MGVGASVTSSSRASFCNTERIEKKIAIALDKDWKLMYICVVSERVVQTLNLKERMYR
jgi:hypothetical protein